jgi:hypothetical protein
LIPRTLAIRAGRNVYEQRGIEAYQVEVGTRWPEDRERSPRNTFQSAMFGDGSF